MIHLEKNIYISGVSETPVDYDSTSFYLDFRNTAAEGKETTSLITGSPAKIILRHALKVNIVTMSTSFTVGLSGAIFGLVGTIQGMSASITLPVIMACLILMTLIWITVPRYWNTCIYSGASYRIMRSYGRYIIEPHGECQKYRWGSRQFMN